jgi:hypothetical protein
MTDLKTLQRLFDFTDDDLAANRAGQLSERQREKFQRRLSQQQWEQTANGLTLVIFIITFVIYIAFSVTYGDQSGPLVMLALIVWLAVMYILSKLMAKLPALMQRRYKYNASFPQPVIEKETGPLIFTSDGEHRYALLNQLEFANSAAVDGDPRLWKLEETEVYTIYYVEELLWIAAIEPA